MQQHRDAAIPLRCGDEVGAWISTFLKFDLPGKSVNGKKPDYL
jgi:hypothetical protein